MGEGEVTIFLFNFLMLTMSHGRNNMKFLLEGKAQTLKLIREQSHIHFHSLHAINQHFNWIREYLRLKWSQWTSPGWFVTLGAVLLCLCVCYECQCWRSLFGEFWVLMEHRYSESVWPAVCGVLQEQLRSLERGLALGIVPSQQYLQDWGLNRWNKSHVHQFLREKQGWSQYYNIFIMVGMRFAQLQKEIWLYLIVIFIKGV